MVWMLGTLLSSASCSLLRLKLLMMLGALFQLFSPMSDSGVAGGIRGGRRGTGYRKSLFDWTRSRSRGLLMIQCVSCRCKV